MPGLKIGQIIGCHDSGSHEVFQANAGIVLWVCHYCFSSYPFQFIAYMLSYQLMLCGLNYWLHC